MALPLNETHDPARRSWVESANAPESEFPIQNLPFGVFSPAAGLPPRVGVAIGDQILDVAAAGPSLEGLAAEAARAGAAPFLNLIMSLGPQAWSALRLGLSRALSAEHGDKNISQHLTPMAKAEIRLPVAFRNFTDFFASIFHASNAGRMFRPDNPLMPNYKYVPVAYHSRASSVRVSGTPVKRPQGQRKGQNEDAPSYGPSRNLDFELELGAFIGMGTELGTDRSGRQSGRARVRLLPAQRLVGARHPGLGISAARAVPRQEFRHHGVAMGGDRRKRWRRSAPRLTRDRKAILPRCRISPMPEDQANGGLDITLEAYFSTDDHA